MIPVRIETPYGNIDLDLDDVHAPITTANFLNLIDNNTLEGADFYRIVISSQTYGELPTIDVIQGGIGWTRCKDVPPIAHEPTTLTGLRHIDGTISMGRTAEFGASSEFFICIGEQRKLDAGVIEGPGAAGFSAFGQVTSGMDVVKTIQQLPTLHESPTGEERFNDQFLIEAVPLKVRRL
ncbi:peptidylprolyl isomerase [Asticcacaulis benevestitus]|uniref:peptidylprolyl isomerase n=1 Tax=Asticcacaulis benevestitus DSM 16100 = ATCC BAA-896 TaxID=1121022 RepID=V4PUC2_9CAUL|nr:peptidylprolyl isomerase [Asticcacaulis benevestitus]ESQ90984.1 hypothetical protein ABENE_11070 [Asticcacaulis benevestitus DSM 16100 = ATCC BAA-896]